MCTSPHTHFILRVSVWARQNTFLLKINTAHIIWSKIATRNCSWTTAHPPCGLHSCCVRHTLTASWNNTSMKSVCGYSIYEQWNPLHLKTPKSVWPCTLLQHLTPHRARSPCSSMGQVAADEHASCISKCLLPPALLRCLAALATWWCWMHLI